MFNEFSHTLCARARALRARVARCSGAMPSESARFASAAEASSPLTSASFAARAATPAARRARARREDPYAGVKNPAAYARAAARVRAAGVHTPPEAPLHRRLDIKVYPWSQNAFALFYFTGNDYFNRSVRWYVHSAFLILRMRPTSVGASNGSAPASITYRMTPHDHQSAARPS